jgi:hypothetical protein
MNFVPPPANSPAKMAGLPANGSRQSGILPFILPKWQEAEAAFGWTNATRQFSRQSVASAGLREAAGESRAVLLEEYLEDVRKPGVVAQLHPHARV